MYSSSMNTGESECVSLARVQFMWAARASWLAFAALAFGLALAGVAPYARLMGVACEREPCVAAQVSAAELAALGGPAAQVLTPLDIRNLTALALFPATAAVLVAALGIWRRPRDPALLLLAFVLTAFGVGEFSLALAREAPALGPAATALRVIYLAGLVPCLWLLPDAAHRPRRLGPAVLATALLGSAVALTPDSVALGLVFSAVAVTIVVASQIVRYRALPDGPERERVVWLAIGLALLAGAQVIGRPLRPLPLPRLDLAGLPMNTIGMPLIAGMVLLVGAFACLAVATLRGELFEAEVVLNRALVYALLTICVIAGYVLVVGYLSLVFQARGNLWLSLVATGVVALLAQPVRARLQRLVNVLLYGARNDPYAVVTRLGQRLEAAVPIDEVLPSVAQAVAADLRLPYAAIIVRQPDGRVGARAASGPPPAGPTLALPLVYQGETLGELVVAPRAGEAGLAASDRRLLGNLTHQLGAAARTVRLTSALQRAREELVTAREEERRRLRRDLHDGLGPALATIAMQGDTARSLLRVEPDEAEALLAELTAQAQTTMEEVRRLIHALRPPVLDDLGLVAALRALVAGFGPSGPAIAVEVPDPLPSLPAAVEVAAYRIAQEALTNVVRHAGARRCVIRVACDEALRVRIADDGRGIPAARPAGVGLTSLRERAEELGGACRILPGEDGGTVIDAELPLGRGHGADSPADR